LGLWLWFCSVVGLFSPKNVVKALEISLSVVGARQNFEPGIFWYKYRIYSACQPCRRNCVISCHSYLPIVEVNTPSRTSSYICLTNSKIQWPAVLNLTVIHSETFNVRNCFFNLMARQP
jgi:hypothetical protein